MLWTLNGDVSPCWLDQSRETRCKAVLARIIHGTYLLAPGRPWARTIHLDGSVASKLGRSTGGVRTRREARLSHKRGEACFLPMPRQRHAEASKKTRRQAYLAPTSTGDTKARWMASKLVRTALTMNAKQHRGTFELPWAASARSDQVNRRQAVMEPARAPVMPKGSVPPRALNHVKTAF